MRITFVVDHKVQQHDGNGPAYKAGETYDLHVSYAEKYKRRGYAVDEVVPVRQRSVPQRAQPTPLVALDAVVGDGGSALRNAAETPRGGASE